MIKQRVVFVTATHPKEQGTKKSEDNMKRNVTVTGWTEQSYGA